MTTRVKRQTLDNGASVVSEEELSELCIRHEPIRALIGRTREATKAPMTIVLTVRSRTDNDNPDPYGLGYVQHQPTNTVRWRLATDGSTTYLVGHQV